VPVPAPKPKRFQPLKSFVVIEKDFEGSMRHGHGVNLEAELFNFGQYSRLVHGLQYCPLTAFYVHLQVIDNILHTPQCILSEQ